MSRILTFLAILFFASSATAQEQYRLQPGDVLSIQVLEDSTLNRQEFILPDGRINVPLAGSILAGGRTVTQVQRNITTALSPNFATAPTVFVSVVGLGDRAQLEAEQVEMIDVFVAGEANNPGKRQIEAGTNLVQFLAEIGGFSRFAAIKRLQLRRMAEDGSEKIILINYHALERGGRVVSNLILQDGDTLVVPQRRLFE
jgi:polysaccharide export outer membrane protein